MTHHREGSRRPFSSSTRRPKNSPGRGGFLLATGEVRVCGALLVGDSGAACALVDPTYIAPGACEGEMGTARVLLRRSDRRAQSLAGSVGLLGFDQLQPRGLKMSPAWIPEHDGFLRAGQRLGLAGLNPERHMLGFLQEASKRTMVILGDGSPVPQAELMRSSAWAYVVGGRPAQLRWLAHCPPGALLEPSMKCLSPPDRVASGG